MPDQLTYDLQRLLKLLQETWAERDAYRIKDGIEASGHTAHWEKVLEAAQARAQELFQPTLVDLDNDVPIIEVVQQLLGRLERS